jgi:hypothetical protein
VLYIGSDAADDESGPRHYFELATSGDPLREVIVEPVAGDSLTEFSQPPAPQLAIVSKPISAGLARQLRAFAEDGGAVVVSPVNLDAAEAIPALLDDVSLATTDKAPEEYLLLGEIDFSHPLFVPFANPRYSDFTKIHFWKRAPVVLAEPQDTEPTNTKIVARFDTGEPAILEQTLGSGRIIALASGWDPENSQFALSSKFVPFVGALLDRACGSAEAMAGVAVGQPVPLPEFKDTAEIQVHPPLASPVLVKPAERAFVQTTEPGVYRLTGLADEQRFAVNLAAAESNTAPLELEQFDRLGVRTAQTMSRGERLDRIRQQRDTELEGRQKIWRWLLAFALGVLIVETVWAGRAARAIARSEASA